MSAPVAASASTAPPPDPAVVAFLQKMYPLYLAIPNAWSHVASCRSAERAFLPADVAACADADSAIIDAARALAKWLKEASVPPTLIDLRSKLVDAAEATDAGFTPRVAALRRSDRQAFNDSMSAAFNGLGQFCEPLQQVRPLDPGEQWPAVECN